MNYTIFKWSMNIWCYGSWVNFIKMGFKHSQPPWQNYVDFIDHFWFFKLNVACLSQMVTVLYERQHICFMIGIEWYHLQCNKEWNFLICHSTFHSSDHHSSIWWVSLAESRFNFILKQYRGNWSLFTECEHDRVLQNLKWIIKTCS